MVFQMCRPVWARFMDVAVLAGALRLPGYDRRRAEYLACNWLPTKWDWVDPLKDANAEIAQIEAGLKSRTQAIAERGYDAEQINAEIAVERNRERRLDYRVWLQCALQSEHSANEPFSLVAFVVFARR